LNERRIRTVLAAAAYTGAGIVLLFILLEYRPGSPVVNPINDVQLRTGRWALGFLLAALAPTPLFRLTGWRPLLALRRAFGLVTFVFVLVHFFNFVWIDYGFNWAWLRQDLLEKRYAVAGVVAFRVLIPALVATFPGARRRLGLTWSRVRWFVYAAAVMAMVHLVWTIKVAGVTRGLTYAVILAVLLAVRLPWLNRLTLKRRRPAP
jgi:sulfoxide reductase heme-binding subunit YedZ